MALVDQKSPLQRKDTKLEKTSGGWPNLIHDINAIVLFAQGFEDIIKPCESFGLCVRWKSLPKNKDYMAAGISVSRMPQLPSKSYDGDHNNPRMNHR